MKTIAVVNRKGGVGKTTSVHCLAEAKALEGYNVLMIDLDPMGCLTLFSGFHPGEYNLEGHSAADLFAGGKELEKSVFEVINFSEKKKIFIVPASKELTEVERSLKPIPANYSLIKNACKEFDKQGFDYIFLDCPPHIDSILVANALVAADEVIIPVDATVLSCASVRDTKNAVTDVLGDHNTKVAGLILTKYLENARQKKILSMLEKNDRILGTVGEITETDIKKEYCEIAKLI